MIILTKKHCVSNWNLSDTIFNMSKTLRIFWGEVQKTQTRCGGILFVLSCLFWTIILVFVSGYVYNQDAENFLCETTTEPKPQAANQSAITECYHLYDKEYNSPVSLGTFALINGLILLSVWALYLLCAFGRLPHDSHQEENPRRPSPVLIRPYVIQLSFRTLYLVVMMALLLGLVPPVFPTSFECSVNNSKYQCFDSLNSEKTSSRKVILVYDGLFGLLTFWELFYVICRWCTYKSNLDLTIHDFNKAIMIQYLISQLAVIEQYENHRLSLATNDFYEVPIRSVS